jgi:hypothetical protein
MSLISKVLRGHLQLAIGYKRSARSPQVNCESSSNLHMCQDAQSAGRMDTSHILRNLRMQIWEEDSETDKLSKSSRERSAHSRYSWLTEFSNSQCLSHFAALFLDIWAKTFFAECCIKSLINWSVKNYLWTRRIRPDLHADAGEEQSHKWFASWNDMACEWSFRRFTYGNLVTTSPSSKSSYSQNFSLQHPESDCCYDPSNSQEHSIGRSDGRCVQRAGT